MSLIRVQGPDFFKTKKKICTPSKTGRALTFRKFPEKMDIGSKKMYLQEVCEGGQKNQGHVTFPIKSRAVVGDIWKNGQNFGDLNFHKI